MGTTYDLVNKLSAAIDLMNILISYKISMSSHWSRMTAKGFSFRPVNKFDNLSISFNVAPNESLTACRNQSEGLSLLLSTPSLRE